MTTILRTCDIDGCTNVVAWEYEPGEPQTWEHPGTSDYWYPSGCAVTKRESIDDCVLGQIVYDVTHEETLAADDNMYTIIERIACESFDNDVWECDYPLEDLPY